MKAGPESFVEDLRPAVRQAAAIARALEGRVPNRPKVGEDSAVKAALTVADTACQEALLVPLLRHLSDVQLEAEEGLEFVFGYEEALGYSVGSLVRDKDGVSAALLFAELAGWCRARNTSVPAHLEQLQQRHGVYLSAQRSFTLPGVSGAEQIRTVLATFRARPPERVGPKQVTGVRDYETGTVRRAGGESATGLPRSNVIAYELEDGARVTLRPSGTEPKIKYYFEILGNG